MTSLDHAIQKTSGPCVILAGAGTGKTTAIVEKVKYLVENDIYAPEKIVCITFSNEAANNLLTRVQKALGTSFESESSASTEARLPIIRTFHAFSADLLRAEGNRIGIPGKFKILDTEQAMVLLHRNLRVPANCCQKYVSTIGSAKDLGIPLSDFKTFVDSSLQHYRGIDLEKRLESLNFELQTLHLKNEFWKKKELIAEIKKLRRIMDVKKFTAAWNAYEKMKQKGAYQDYADLNANALLLLQQFPECAAAYEYIIVDEFQDTNKLQLDFLLHLATRGNITVVGDMNQSIYRFRGAYSKNLELFKEAFSVKEGDVATLAKSHRSPNTILRVAHQLIQKNYATPDECFFVESAQGREGRAVEVIELQNAHEEARKIVEIVQEEQKNGTSLEEICIMFRAHQYGRVVRHRLEEAGIPYHAVAKSSLLKQKSVKTALDYLTIINKLKRHEKGGEQAWWDLIYQLQFQQEDIIIVGSCIKTYTKKQNGGEKKSVMPTEEQEPLSPYLMTHLEQLELTTQGKHAAHALIEKLKQMLAISGLPISQLVQEIYRLSGLVSLQPALEEKESLLNLNKFYELAKTHEELYDSDLANFLYYIDIVETLGIEMDAAQLEEKGVRLMTSHASKGLEYKTVIVSNVAQGRFPNERHTNNALIPTELLPELKHELAHLSDEEKEGFVSSYEQHHQLLEERRLCYVSCTRAKERLVLTYALAYGEKKVAPSAFLQEIQYKKNSDIVFLQDHEQKVLGETEARLMPSPSFATVLQTPGFETALQTLAQQKPREGMKQRLSPSALRLFAECQKEFEYKYVYHMPERKTVSWEAMRLGSFVHLVLEQGVQACFCSLQEFLERAHERALDEEWQGIPLDEAKALIRVFFERNKGRYSAESKTEQYLALKLADIDFMGFADRIDFNADSIDIIDYKTGKTAIAPLDRNWQLGFYALAAQKKYGLPARRVVLDMLKQERPLEFEFDAMGNARCTSSKFIPGFSLQVVKEELIATAQAIQNAYREGFKACLLEKNCEFCNEYVYGG